MTEVPYLDRINDAHDKGHLFAHMFESRLEMEGVEGGAPLHRIKDLLEVMAKQDEAGYLSFSHRFPATEHGILGLSTTALNKKFPVRLFNFSSHVGLLMDRAQPVLVSSIDRKTSAAGGSILFAQRGDCAAILEAQQITPESIHVPILKDLPGRIAMAKNALEAMWKYIEDIRWDRYVKEAADRAGTYDVFNPGMNEVNVVAELKNICGIVVDRSTGDTVAESLKAAVSLKEYLMENYRDTFNHTLPIVSYDVSRGTPEIEVLDEAKIKAIIASESTKTAIIDQSAGITAEKHIPK